MLQLEVIQRSKEDSHGVPEVAIRVEERRTTVRAEVPWNGIAGVLQGVMVRLDRFFPFRYLESLTCYFSQAECVVVDCMLRTPAGNTTFVVNGVPVNFLQFLQWQHDILLRSVKHTIGTENCWDTYTMGSASTSNETWPHRHEPLYGLLMTSLHRCNEPSCVRIKNE